MTVIPVVKNATQPDDENDANTKNLNHIEKQTTKSHEQMTIDSFATECRCCKETNSEQSLQKISHLK